MRTKKFGSLDGFKLFYEELVVLKKPVNRIRRYRGVIPVRTRQIGALAR